MLLELINKATDIDRGSLVKMLSEKNSDIRIPEAFIFKANGSSDGIIYCYEFIENGKNMLEFCTYDCEREERSVCTAEGFITDFTTDEKPQSGEDFVIIRLTGTNVPGGADKYIALTFTDSTVK